MSLSDLSASLQINQEEARLGTTRVITLPGPRRITVNIPAGTVDGQILRKEGLGERSESTGMMGDLLLTIRVEAPKPRSPYDDELPTYKTPYDPGLLREYPPVPQQPARMPDASTSPLPDMQRGNSGGIPPVRPGPQPVGPPPMEAPLGYQQMGNPPTPLPFGGPPTPMPYSPTPSPAQYIQQQGPPPFPKPELQRPAGGFVAWRELLIVGTILLLFAGSVTTFYLVRYNQLVDSGVKATETAQIRTVSTVYAATAAAQASATSVAERNPYPPNIGTLMLDDPLDTGKHGNGWDEVSNCSFKEGNYLATATGQGVNYCLASPTFANFTYQVEMQITKGEAGGLIFRFDRAKNSYYYFNISTRGTFALLFSNNNTFVTIASGNSAAIKTTATDLNAIAVVAKGKTITLYVNQQQVLTIPDGLYVLGQIGVAAGNNQGPADVSFRNAKVWNI